MKVRNVRPSSLRGLPRDWGDVPVGERGAIILGGNGTGKSSIVDAVEIAIAGESSLYPENQLGVNWDRGSPHVIDGAPEVTCTIEDDAGDRHEVTLNDPIPDTVSEWIELARSSSFVLRRHMLLRFIVARPAERYQALAAFLDLSEYSALEAQLHGLATSIEAEIAEHDTTVNTSEQKLRDVFGLERGDDVNLGALADLVRVAAIELDLIGDGDEVEIQTLAERAEAALKDQNVTKDLEHFAGLKGSAARLSLPASLGPQFEAAKAAVEALEKTEYEEIQLHLVAVINASLELLSVFAVETCPVCETEIDRDQLESTLRSRLKASEELIQARDAAQTMTDSLRRTIRRVAAEYRAFIDASGDLSTRDEWQLYQRALDALTDAEDHLQAVPTMEVLTRIETSITGLVSTHEPILTTLDTLINELGGTERWKATRNVSVQAGLCVSEGETLRKASTTRSSLTRQHGVAIVIANHASEARKQAVSEILDGVTATANSYYEEIHPDEGIATTRLQVRAATDASVRLICEFAGSEENPQLHYSESHLDTLGLCYFLAIRRKQADENPDFKLMVLDDVMHSVDSNHRARVVQLLRDQFADHQIIVTTHDDVFYRKLREVFRQPEIEQHRLGAWTLQRGPVLVDSATDIDRITVPEIRAQKSAEELASAAGRFLESQLKRLTEGLQINVVARFESRHTIADLWPPLKSKVRRVRSFTDAHDDLVDRVDENLWMRNEIGAHDNESAAPPSDEEVRELAELLTDFYGATFCAECRVHIKRQDNGDWQCRCGRLHYSRN